MTPADLSDQTIEELKGLYDQIIAGTGPIEPAESRIRCKDGSFLEVEVHRQAYKTGDDWIIVGIARDITQRKENDQRMLQMAHYDTLTGLPNRNLFYHPGDGAHPGGAQRLAVGRGDGRSGRLQQRQ